MPVCLQQFCLQDLPITNSSRNSNRKKKTTISGHHDQPGPFQLHWNLFVFCSYLEAAWRFMGRDCLLRHKCSLWKPGVCDIKAPHVNFCSISQEAHPKECYRDREKTELGWTTLSIWRAIILRLPDFPGRWVSLDMFFGQCCFSRLYRNVENDESKVVQSSIEMELPDSYDVWGWLGFGLVKVTSPFEGLTAVFWLCVTPLLGRFMPPIVLMGEAIQCRNLLSCRLPKSCSIPPSHKARACGLLVLPRSKSCLQEKRTSWMLLVLGRWVVDWCDIASACGSTARSSPSLSYR